MPPANSLSLQFQATSPSPHTYTPVSERYRQYPASLVSRIIIISSSMRQNTHSLSRTSYWLKLSKWVEGIIASSHIISGVQTLQFHKFSVWLELTVTAGTEHRRTELQIFLYIVPSIPNPPSSLFLSCLIPLLLHQHSLALALHHCTPTTSPSLLPFLVFNPFILMHQTFILLTPSYDSFANSPCIQLMKSLGSLFMYVRWRMY